LIDTDKHNSTGPRHNHTAKQQYTGSATSYDTRPGNEVQMSPHSHSLVTRPSKFIKCINDNKET